MSSLLNAGTLDLVTEALSHLPKNSLEWTERFKVLCALKGLGEDGVLAASGWMGEPMAKIRKRFEPIDPKRVSISSIYYLAQQNGWENKHSGISSLFRYDADEMYSERYVRATSIQNLPRGTRVLSYKSDKGTGKTEELIRLVNQVSPDKTVLSIGHRRTLLRQAAHRLGLGYYEEIEAENLSQQTRLAITLDSLPKIAPQKLPDNIGLVIIDEVSQVLHHLLGETVARDRQNIVTTLRGILSRAELVVILDADVTNVEVEFIQQMVGSTAGIYRIHNTYQYQGKSTTAYRTRGALVAHCVDQLQAGRSCYVACNTRDQAISVYGYLSQFSKTSRLVTSRETTEPETQAFISNINEEIRGCQLVVASPSLGTGVDIQTHVDNVYLIACQFDKLSHSDLLQQLWRVRNPGEVHTWVEHKIASKIVDPDALKSVAIEAGRVVIDFNELGERVVIRSHNEELYLNLWALNTAKMNYSTNNLADNFYRSLECSGWQITWEQEDSEQAKELDAQLKERKRQRKNEDAEAIIAARHIDAEEYKELVKDEARTLTDVEQAEATSYRIRRAYCVDQVTHEVINHYAGGTGARTLVNYADLVSENPETLLELDKQEAKFVYLPDIQHREIKRSLRAEVLRLAFGTDDLNAILSGSVETTEQGMKNLEDYRRSMGKKIAVMLNLSGSGNYLVKAVLQQLGVDMKAYKRKGKDGARFRSYTVTGHELVASVIERKSMEKQALAERYNDTIF